MFTRRNFISSAMIGTSGFALAPLLGGLPLTPAHAIGPKPKGTKPAAHHSIGHYKLPHAWGLGGVAIGNGFKPTTEDQALAALEAAWESGVRYYDTSPWYGLGLSERRFGAFLSSKKREDYVLSTKVGRLFTAGKARDKVGLWMTPSPFDYKYDYSAAGVRRSIEDSLQRMGINSIDIVFIHDLNRGNTDHGDKWLDQFAIAQKGAMPELTKMREEGLIRGWGLGVNEPEPILKAIEVADPDIVLAATQYSLIKHDDALDRLFPACAKAKVSVVVGAPLNAGFLAGADRYDYTPSFPTGAKDKRSRLENICKEHSVDLRTAALQFSAAPEVVAAVIPGARTPEQARQNAESMKVKIPTAFWQKLKSEKLISEKAPLPPTV